MRGNETVRRARGTKVLHWSLLVLIVGVVSFSAGEILLRLFIRANGTDSPITYVPHGDYYTYMPTTSFTSTNEEGATIVVETDERGLRNPRGTYADSEIVILGDSFISAVNTPQDETMVGHLRRSGFRAYNAGMDGFSTFQSLLLLRNLLREARPRVVVLGFYLGNDFRDNYLPYPNSLPLPSDQNSNIELPSANRRSASPVRSLLKKSVLCTYCYHGLYRPWFKGEPNGIMAQYSLSEMDSFRFDHSPEMDVGVRNTQVALTVLARLSREYGFEFLVLGIPSKAQVYGSFREIWYFNIDKNAREFALETIRQGYSFDRPDELARRAAVGAGIEYIPLLPVFRQNGEKKLYHHVDVHWSPAGQQLAAEHLTETILAKRRTTSS